MSFLDNLRARLSGAKSTEQLMRAATENQMASRWTEAATLWKQAIEKAPADVLAQLNYSICLYRMSRFKDAAGRAAYLTTQLEETHAHTAALIALLSFHAAGEFQHAAQLANALHRMVSDPVDLPGMPQYAFQGILEDKDAMPIINALRDLATKKIDPSLRDAIKALATLYEQRQRQFAR